MSKKILSSLQSAVQPIDDGATIMIGGFGGSGAPIELIHALINAGPKNLTVINNNAGNGHVGVAAMIEHGMVAKMICSYPRSSNPRVFTELYLANGIELELIPQGTLAERIRAGGAGIPAFYTPASVGTDIGKNKPSEEFEGKTYVRELWLKANFALIKASQGDERGNLTYRMSARNFNPIMAMAATTTVAQVSAIVPAGSIDPEHVITPGIFVNGLIAVANPLQEESLNQQGAVYKKRFA